MRIDGPYVRDVGQKQALSIQIFLTVYLLFSLLQQYVKTNIVRTFFLNHVKALQNRACYDYLTVYGLNNVLNQEKEQFNLLIFILF